MDVSENSGIPKSSTLIGFSIINHPFWVSPFLETPIWTHLTKYYSPPLHFEVWNPTPGNPLPLGIRGGRRVRVDPKVICQLTSCHRLFSPSISIHFWGVPYMFHHVHQKIRSVEKPYYNSVQQLKTTIPLETGPQQKSCVFQYHYWSWFHEKNGEHSPTSNL